MINISSRHFIPTRKQRSGAFRSKIPFLMSEQCHATFFVFRPFILQCVTCCSLFATVPQPVEKTRVYKRASSPLFFLYVYGPSTAQRATRTHWRK
ncbi:hypothetical protein HMPREF1330_01611 [Enterococcus faecalis ERV129]|nr:hypothetical protein HMPREF1330_01611 [Enterococcus faecalis ERV129]